MGQIKVVCIKDIDGVYRGDVLTAWKQFNKMFYIKGLSIKVGLDPVEFWKNFMVFNPYYTVQKPTIKKRFRKPKKQFMTVKFNGISERLLSLLYTHDFSYIEDLKRRNPIFIEQFNYSIVSTLEKLEKLYHQIPDYQFEQAVINSEQVFKEICKMSTEIEKQSFNEGKTADELLQDFMSDNKILSDFFKEMNK